VCSVYYKLTACIHLEHYLLIFRRRYINKNLYIGLCLLAATRNVVELLYISSNVADNTRLSNGHISYTNLTSCTFTIHLSIYYVSVSIFSICVCTNVSSNSSMVFGFLRLIFPCMFCPIHTVSKFSNSLLLIQPITS
jgi:hypothetical protein